MPDYRALAQALDPYAMDTGGITPDTIKALQSGYKSPNLLGMIGDIGRGGLSNLESLVRGGVAQVPGTAGDLETLGRMGINTSFGAGGVKVNPKAVLPTTTDILGMMPQRVTQSRPETAGMEELGTMIAPGLAKAAAPVVKGGGNLLGMAMNERMLAGQPILPSLAKEPQSAMFAVQPIDLNKGIYKPDLTMDEMLKVKDIPTVDRVRQSIDLVGEDQFKKMVDAQYQKYKPTDQDQEAMLVESVTLDILGKAQRSPYPQEQALKLAQERAALPVSEGGLGLPKDNTPEMRYQAMKGIEGNFVHGAKEPDITSFKTKKQLFEEKYANNPEGAIADNHYANERNAVFLSPNPQFTENFSVQGYTDVGQAPTSYPLKVVGDTKVFDFENPQHLEMLKQKYAELFPLKTIGKKGYVPSEESIRMHTINKRIENLPNDVNNWPAMENKDFQRAIQELGFDAFHVNERGTKNIGIYDPSTLRSPFAAFDPFRKDVATATAMGVALPDLLAAEAENKKKQLSKVLTK